MLPCIAGAELCARGSQGAMLRLWQQSWRLCGCFGCISEPKPHTRGALVLPSILAPSDLLASRHPVIFRTGGVASVISIVTRAEAVVC